MFCEKPLTDDPIAAERLAALAPRRLFVMDKWRYHPCSSLPRSRANAGSGAVRGCAPCGSGATRTRMPIRLEFSPRTISRSSSRSSALGQPGGGRRVARRSSDAAERHPPRRRLVAGGALGPSAAFLRRGRCRCLPTAGTRHVTIYRHGADGIREERIETPGELPLLAELRAFVEHLGGGPAPRSSAAEGAAVVSTIASPRPRRVIDATILIPTFRTRRSCDSRSSALDQQGPRSRSSSSGTVWRTTPAAIRAGRDERLRFFDFAKENSTESSATKRFARRPGASCATCPTTTCCCVITPRRWLFARGRRLRASVSARLAVDGTLEYFPCELLQARVRGSRPRRKASIRLTGTAHARGVPPAAARMEDDSAWRANRPLHVAAMARAARVPRCDERSAHVPDLSRSVVGTAPAGGPTAALEAGSRRSREPGFAEELDVLLQAAIRRRGGPTTWAHASSSPCRRCARRGAGAYESSSSSAPLRPLARRRGGR